MSKLKNYNSIEGNLLKELFQANQIDPFIALIVESYIYEEVIKYHIGNKWLECTYKYGLLEGLYQTYYDNGQKLEAFHYKKGKKEGLSRGWFRSGKDWYECVYKNNKKEGLYQEWCNDKQLKRLTFYIDGKEEGLDQKWFYINGQKWMKLNYKNGKQEGISEVWYENGQKRYEANYINGKHDGERKEWNEQGDLTIHRIYKDDEEIEVIL